MKAYLKFLKYYFRQKKKIRLLRKINRLGEKLNACYRRYADLNIMYEELYGGRNDD